MAYFEITAKVEEVNESTYTRQTTGEIVTKIQLSLVVPSMRERVLCELPLDAAPKPDVLDRWEMEEAWVKVGADGMRALGFKRKNARPGENENGALVVFQAGTIREASTDERRELQQARRTAKLQAKQRRAARQAEKRAETASVAAQASKQPA